MNIRLLKRNQINIQRWDECVSQSKNGLVYAFSWYLDAVAPQWQALVEGDYQAFMPLAVGKKYGIDYLYQPFHTQQLGIFSPQDLSPQKIQQFIELCAANFKFVELNLNQFNLLENSPFELQTKINHQIQINQSYEKLYAKYRRNTKRNLNKGIQNGIKIQTQVPIHEFIRLFRQNVGLKVEHLLEQHYQSLERLLQVCLNKQTACICGAYTSANELCAVGFFVTALQKTIFLVCASTPQGKENNAMYVLVDYFIQQRAEKDSIFDFSGSNDSGIGYFNEGFGAEKQNYMRLKINRLPYLLRVFKK